MIQKIFDWCVRILEVGAEFIGVSYEAINVWIFVFIYPAAMIALLTYVFFLRSRLSESNT